MPVAKKKPAVGVPTAKKQDEAKKPAAPKKKATWPAFTERFGPTVRDAGVVLIPRVLLTGLGELSIKPIHAVVLMQLIACWGSASDHPFPKRKLLRKWLGCDKRTLDRAIADLVSLGLIEKRRRPSQTRRQTSNEYDLTNLVERLKPLGRKAIVENRKRAARRAAASD
jgi:DNA-binding HxlR family transcriptional regulator